MALHGIEGWFFWVLALAALLGALFTVLSRSAVHSAVCLMTTLIATGGLFLLMRAEFVMGVQILVYVGGVIVLFLFVVMLVNVREERLDQARLFSKQWIGAVVAAGGKTIPSAAARGRRTARGFPLVCIQAVGSLLESRKLRVCGRRNSRDL